MSRAEEPQYLGAVCAAIHAVAVVSLVDPYPSDSGRKVVLAGFLEHLADRVGAANVHYLLVGGRAAGSKRTFPVKLHELPGPKTVHRVTSLLTHSGTGRRSLQEAIVRSPEVAKVIAGALRELAVDLEVYDTVRLGQYASSAGVARQVCYLDDLFSERYRQMLDTMRRYPGVDLQPLGTFEHQVPEVLRPLATNRRSQRVLLAAEERLIRRSEDRAARRFDTCLLVNPGEAELLRARTGVGCERVMSVPPLVSRRRTAERCYRGAPQYIFLGLLSQPHNEDGLRSFLLGIWPELMRRCPKARLRVIGREPRQGLRDLVARHGDSVVLEGYVPDLDSVFADAAAMINPLRFGTGINIKVIEALGRGLPVVASPTGADGIANGPDAGVFLTRYVDDTVEVLLRLTDPETNLRASKAAEAHFERRYSREAAFARYDQAFGFAS